MEKEIWKLLNSFQLFGVKLDKRNKHNLAIYLTGLLKTYIGSFSVLQMSGTLNYSYDKLQHLASHSGIKEKAINTARLAWAKSTGITPPTLS